MIDEMQYMDFQNNPLDRTTEIVRNHNKDDVIISSIIIYEDKKDKNKFLNLVGTICNQTFKKFEIIIYSYNNSIDEQCEEKINEYRGLGYDIKEITNLDAGQKTVNGISLDSKGDIIVLSKTNTLLDSTLFETIYWSALTNHEAMVLTCNCVQFNYKNKLITGLINPKNKTKDLILNSTLIIKRDVLKQFINVNIKELYSFVLKSEFVKKYKIFNLSYYGIWQEDNNKGKHKNISIKASKNINSGLIVNYPIESEREFVDEACQLNIGFNIASEKDKKTNLLFVFPWAVIGGADKFNYELIKRIPRDKYNVFIVLTEEANYVLRQEFEKYVNEIFDLNTFIQKKYWTNFIEYILVSRNIDLVFISNSYYMYGALPYIKSRFKDIPFVDFLHAEDMSLRNGGYPKDSEAVHNFLSKTFTCTKYLEKFMVEKMDILPSKIRTIYIGVDSEKFDPNLELEETLKVSTGKKILTFICRLDYVKRPCFAIEVMNLICKKRKDIVLYIIGEGKLLEKCKNMVRKYGLTNNVVFTGSKLDVRPYYKISEALLVCSLSEGLSITTYEALSMGVPVITADVGGQAELVNDNCGELIRRYQDISKDLFNYNYENDEINEYAKAIEKIVDMDEIYKEDMKIKCREQILEGYTLDNMSSSILVEIDKLIKLNVNNSNNYVDNNLYRRYLVMHNELTKKPQDSILIKILKRYNIYGILKAIKNRFLSSI